MTWMVGQLCKPGTVLGASESERASTPYCLNAVFELTRLILSPPGFLRVHAGDHVRQAYVCQPSEYPASNPRSVASAVRLAGEGDLEDSVYTGTWQLLSGCFCHRQREP